MYGFFLKLASEIFKNIMAETQSELDMQLYKNAEL